MSQNPQRVLADVTVTWGSHANGAGLSGTVRHGTVADIVPGSALAAAYGGAGNLSGIIPAAQRGDGATLDHVAVSN